MSHMFWGTKLEELNLSSFNTKNILFQKYKGEFPIMTVKEELKIWQAVPFVALGGEILISIMR